MSKLTRVFAALCASVQVVWDVIRDREDDDDYDRNDLLIAVAHRVPDSDRVCIHVPDDSTGTEVNAVGIALVRHGWMVGFTEMGADRVIEELGEQ